MFDMFQLPFMTQAFEAAVITGLLLSYLGVHVVGRGIVFVDLALGQISSLGVAFAAFIGTGLTSIPLIFTLVGALLMSFINIRDKRLKQEAIIGILYAFASALTVLLISKTPHGDSDIQEVLFGNILSVSNEKIITIGIVFGVIALVQLIFFKKFLNLTKSFESGENHRVGIFNFWNSFLYFDRAGYCIRGEDQRGDPCIFLPYHSGSVRHYVFKKRYGGLHHFTCNKRPCQLSRAELFFSL
jgi:hypothetical protein